MSIPETMSAVQLHGHGGPEQLIHSTDVPTPRPGPDEVLIDVHACGMNNTDIWVREGAYGSDTDPAAVSSWRRGRPTLTFPASRARTSSAASPPSAAASTARGPGSG